MATYWSLSNAELAYLKNFASKGMKKMAAGAGNAASKAGKLAGGTTKILWSAATKAVKPLKWTTRAWAWAVAWWAMAWAAKWASKIASKLRK